MKKFLNYWKSVFGLAFQIAKAEFKLRNEGTWLGNLWYLLIPILTFLIFFGVFSQNLGENIPNYAVYLFMGIIVFGLFQKVTDESVKTIKQHQGIIKSINFNRVSLVFASLLKSVFAHFFEMLVLVGLFILFGISLKGLIFYPFILVFFLIFIFGSSLILASISVYFVDLENIWSFVSRIVWLLTPIFYSSDIKSHISFLNYLNPLFYYISAFRELVIYLEFPSRYILFGCFAASAISLILGLLLFDKLSRRFAEMI